MNEVMRFLASTLTTFTFMPNYSAGLYQNQRAMMAMAGGRILATESPMLLLAINENSFKEDKSTKKRACFPNGHGRRNIYVPIEAISSVRSLEDEIQYLVKISNTNGLRVANAGLWVSAICLAWNQKSWDIAIDRYVEWIRKSPKYPVPLVTAVPFLQPFLISHQVESCRFIEQDELYSEKGLNGWLFHKKIEKMHLDLKSQVLVDPHNPARHVDARAPEKI